LGSRAFLLLAFATSGCGHRATVEECEEIVERIAKLELEKRAPNDPTGVAEQIDEMKKQLRETTMKDCVGKRITEGAMRCVREAKTSKEIVEQCFD
jgi:small lipoprotein (TIGR04454 family)